MATIITYICDATGKSSNNKEDFVNVEIVSRSQTGDYNKDKPLTIKKIIHIDIAKKLNMINIMNNEPTPPEVTFEGKLKALLEDHVSELVQNHLDSQ